MNKIVGVDVGGTKMLMIGNGRIEKKVPTGKSFSKADLKYELDSFVSGLPFIPDALGIALPGLVENAKTLMTSDVLPQISGIDIEYLRQEHCLIYLINDVKAALIEETSDLSEKDIAVVIMVGTGIALGIRVGGELVNGYNGWAGELGSIPIPTPDGVQKLDEVASGASILVKAQTDAATLIRKLEKDDPEMKGIVCSAGEYLGLGIATVINILNPNIISLGGGALKYKYFYESAVESAKKFALPELWAECKIGRVRRIDHVVVLGAQRYAEKMMRNG